ncbi:UDP-N-acetylmuramoyl-L-alanyl-D-glutamate--2,6-diaminopimelate ligase [Spirulina major]|uniref:UDP-N-acetylmuramoyl-L-alanyl-D-glutamate--2, 6-diaminopimelate ligase n=1 Tax=Spirulina major TaxID=270636 RepID=UPI0009350ACA|nr:UDP-N-acetylmuramoyl-L-alanyl-D-glutamate--2,6-diaminopimelate ligase [Spirulina major]
MKLRELLSQVPGLDLPNHAALDQEVKGLSTNSHACQAGDLFIGMPGTRVDGGEFWSGAIASGAIAAIVTPEAAAKCPPKAGECVIPVADLVHQCATVAAVFYDKPATQMAIVGVTGTNGKTTTTHLIEYFLNPAPTALIGTLYTRWPGYEKTAVNTTPFAIDLQAQLAHARNAGSQHAVMEVSSHGLHQGRVKACPFRVAVFTNLTQDHLDYHGTMENYFQAKALLFNDEYLHGRAIINADDPYGQRLLAQLGDKAWSYSVSDATADLWLSDLDYGATGVTGTIHTPQGEAQFQSPLVGQFNLANLLAATGAALELGVALETIMARLPEFMGVPGRMERVQISPEQDITVIVDYAHTPDSLENLLKAARPFIPGRSICVFGCGGDRDRTKRPIMGKIAADLSDLAVVTSDNPRTEDPDQILKDVVAGIPTTAEPMVEGDRAAAIRQAILTAHPGDGVLIAGKGHEDYQILGTEKIHFDDREQARAALSDRAHG